MENNITLTPAGRQKLVEELAYREGEKHDEIVERIKVARDFGDLSENSEFDDAKEEEAKNAARINEIRNILATATVVDSSSNAGISIGCTVKLIDERGKEITYQIVGTTETNSLEHKISNESPAGAALIGHTAGDTISFVAPSGKTREFTIVDIVR